MAERADKHHVAQYIADQPRRSQPQPACGREQRNPRRAGKRKTQQKHKQRGGDELDKIDGKCGDPRLNAVEQRAARGVADGYPGGEDLTEKKHMQAPLCHENVHRTV